MYFDLTKNRDGLLFVDKPVGWTSFDVCAKIRGQVRADYRARGQKPTKRQLRVGHAGTLDPFATGLLIILLGDATKRVDGFMKLDKVYQATLRLGETSSTGDPEGKISEVSSLRPDVGAVESVLARFVGRIEQTPPAYSAIKIGGRRAYDLARQGKSVEIPSRQVQIHSLKLIDYAYPLIKIETHVSSGTYIRSLAADIGAQLSTGAYCLELRRTKIGDYSVNEAQKIREFDTASEQGGI